MLLRRRKALVCREVVELLTDYLDGTLSPRDRTRLEGHLALCPPCSTYLAQIRSTISLAGHVAPDDLSAEALDDLIEVYRRWQTD